MAEAVLTTDNRDACLTGLTAALSTTSKLALFTNLPVLSPDTVLADLTLATFTGSAPKTVATWSDPYTDPLTGQRVVTGVGGTFIASGVTAPETVNGWAITDSAGMVLETASYLPAPVPIVNVGDGLVVEPTIQYGA